MWGFGGRFYWGREDRIERRSGGGIVVVFAWMSSQEKHLKNYVRLYASLGWDSLVCHSEFLNMFFPEKASALGLDLLKELVQELKMRPCPVVFASFSGGPKALDFTSDLGARFIVHPSVLKISNPPRIASWIANGISSGLDALFVRRFESHRAEYWQTLYASVRMGAPYLILCSENDDLAPYQVICNFAQRIQQLGGDLKLVKFNGSPHVGHYHYYPIDYKDAVTELCKIALSPNKSFRGTLVQSDNFLLPSSIEYYEGRDFGSVQDQHGKNVEDWDLKSSVSSSRHQYTSRRNSHFNPIKCIRRSRL
ncbi:origin recognition complex subunit 2-like [Hibiscus syriacus]|uniref:Origin recognition complex subunit 2-like n=1 Tax=Hibiscus syriacus TaxID=106335 RepID=A0A6A3CVX2_HIBSY|nr:origin recognition complex subunit 2-like [Hibiscus syriacus]